MAFPRVAIVIYSDVSTNAGPIHQMQNIPLIEFDAPPEPAD